MTMHFVHNPDDPAEAMAHRAMEAIKAAMIAEFGDESAPNITIVVASPPDGRVGIASTEPHPQLVLEALEMGWGAVHKGEREAGRPRHHPMWGRRP